MKKAMSHTKVSVMLKRAALFSALTGLRHCDIMKMKWSELSKEGEHYRIKRKRHLSFIKKCYGNR